MLTLVRAMFRRRPPRDIRIQNKSFNFYHMKGTCCYAILYASSIAYPLKRMRSAAGVLSDLGNVLGSFVSSYASSDNSLRCDRDM